MALTENEVGTLVNWEKWKVVFVRSKEEHMKVRSGYPTKEFWDVWRNQKDEIKALGIYVKKEEDQDGETPPQWVVTQWKEADENEKLNAQQEWEAKNTESE